MWGGPFAIGEGPNGNWNQGDTVAFHPENQARCDDRLFDGSDLFLN
jgi:hypothetical protein